jgi:hypothetical protein
MKVLVPYNPSPFRNSGENNSSTDLTGIRRIGLTSKDLLAKNRTRSPFAIAVLIRQLMRRDRKRRRLAVIEAHRKKLSS